MSKVVWNGVEEIKPLLVLVDEPIPLVDNPRKGDVDAVALSYETFGQMKPIVLQLSSGQCIAGNHQLLAARQLGWTHIAVVRADVTDEEARAYALADNRTAELGGYDNALLLKAYHSLPDHLVAATGWTEQALSLIAAPRLDPNQEWAGMPGYESNDRQSIFSCVVHFPSDEDADAFFARIERSKAKVVWWPDTDGHQGSTRQEHIVSADE